MRGQGRYCSDTEEKQWEPELRNLQDSRENWKGVSKIK